MASTDRQAARAAAIRGQRGFTVIEVLITLAVTLIGLGGLMTLHHVMSEGTATAGRMAEASSIAEAALEAVRRAPFGTLETQLGAVPIDVELEQASGRGERVYGRHIAIEAIDSVSQDLFRVRIEVTWSDDGAVAGAEDGIHDHTFVLETFRTRQESM